MHDWVAPEDWRPPGRLAGCYAALERLRPDHAGLLWPAMAETPDIWRWLSYGPFAEEAAFAAHVAGMTESSDPAFYAISGEGVWSGIGSLMRIDRANGVIEIGNLCFAPALRRTRSATEAIFLMAEHAFEAGFRRLEWKCNALNRPSRKAALRFGFHYEGTFRQAAVVKGASRDTAWFAVLDGEWPALREAYRRWLDPSNFGVSGQQACALSDLVADRVAGLERPDGSEGPLGV